MGNVCSNKIQKNSSKSANNRKASAESIPYGGGGQTASDNNTANSIKPEAESSVSGHHSTSISERTVQPSQGTVKSDSSQQQQKQQQSSANIAGEHVPITGASLSSASQTSAAENTVPGVGVSSSLSPVPVSSSPSPYSYSGAGGSTGQNTANAYQNVSPIKGHLSLAEYDETVRGDSFTQIFSLRCDLLIDSDDSAANSNNNNNNINNNNNGTTPTNPNASTKLQDFGVEDFYVIVISTESDEMIVWNVYEDKPVRTMRSIPKPRDVRMVNQVKAVVLCNRELQLYDLDKATLLTKLKGVMNQKMPYYGLHNEKSVVALSRNRMYVNVLNLDTGDLEITFKAGEDRFLNSLLTSANGKICVCGDETQKPFPLLVWDLINRKLIYDLRIPHHEFITSLSAISDDGHYVVSVCKECNSLSPNFLIVYDLQSGTLFKKWKPECNSVSVAMASGCVVNGIENNHVLVWDLSTGNIKYTLKGHTAPADLLQPAAKANVVLSYNSTRIDPELRIWSLDQGTCLWVFTPMKALSCCCLMPNGRTLVYGFVGEKSLQIAIRPVSDDGDIKHSNSDDEHAQSDELFIADMCSKIIPYGQNDRQGQIVDLK